MRFQLPEMVLSDEIEEDILCKGCKDHVMDVDHPPLDIPSSTMKHVKHSETTLENGVPKVISCIKDAEGNLSSHSISMAVEQVALDMVEENTGTIKEDLNLGSTT